MAAGTLLNVVAGRSCESTTGRWLTTANPFPTARDWAEVPRCGSEDAAAAIEAAHAAFTKGSWPAMSATNRGQAPAQAWRPDRPRRRELAAPEVRDNGKLWPRCRGSSLHPGVVPLLRRPGGQDRGQRAAPGQAEQFTYTRTSPSASWPAITPWNSPLMLATWKLAPALAAGTRARSSRPSSPRARRWTLPDLFNEAGFPAGVFNAVHRLRRRARRRRWSSIRSCQDRLHRRRHDGRSTSTRRPPKGIKHVTMELGGKSPNIVFADADLDQAVFGAISGIFAASGQTCIAGSRLLVQRSSTTPFVAAAPRLGQPASSATRWSATTQAVRPHRAAAREGPRLHRCRPR